MGKTPCRVAAACAMAVVAAASVRAARADGETVVRAVIDRRDARRVLLDSELPAGKDFTLELVGATANDQAVVTIAYKDDCTKAGEGRQRHQLVMLPVTRDGATVMQARIPRLQIRKRYCVGIELWGGLAAPVLDAIAGEVMADAGAQLDQVRIDDEALRTVILTRLASSLAPRLRARSLDAEPGTPETVAAATIGAFAISAELKALRDSHALFEARTSYVLGAPAGAGATATTGVAAIADRAHAIVDDALRKRGALSWPGPTQLFVIDDELVPADRVWPLLDRPEYRTAVMAQLAARQRDPRFPQPPLDKWWAELGRTTGTRAAAAPVLAAVGPVDVWLATRGGHGPAGFARVDASLTSAGLTGAEWRSVAAQLRSLAAAMPAGGPPALASRSTVATTIADAIIAMVEADAALVEGQAALDQARAAYQTARTAAEAQLRALLIAALQERRFQMSAGRTASGEGTTTSLENWISINVGVAAALPITRSYDAQTDVHGDPDVHGWLVPYFAVNVHAPQERTIPPGRLVDELWQRLCLTGGILITNPEPIEGHALQPVLFSRAALAAVGVRVTPYSRIAIGSIFYRVQTHAAGGDTSVGFAPFVGYSLDIDAVKLIKDGFGSM